MAVMELFKELAKQGKTILMVTHDQELARQSSRIVTVYDGQIMPDNLAESGRDE